MAKEKTGRTLERGVVLRFDAERGFGFLRARGYGDEDVFVHVTAVAGGRPLRPGQRVRFAAEPSSRGPRATHVEPGRMGLTPAAAVVAALAATLVAATVALVAYEKWPPALAWLAAINPATFAAFALDKSRAQRGARRVPERALLGLSLLGGSPGAAVAMMWLRHKTRKPAFLGAFAGVVLVQVAALAWWAWERAV